MRGFSGFRVILALILLICLVGLANAYVLSFENRSEADYIGYYAPGSYTTGFVSINPGRTALQVTGSDTYVSPDVHVIFPHNPNLIVDYFNMYVYVKSGTARIEVYDDNWNFITTYTLPAGTKGFYTIKLYGDTLVIYNETGVAVKKVIDTGVYDIKDIQLGVDDGSTDIEIIATEPYIHVDDADKVLYYVYGSPTPLYLTYATYPTNDTITVKIVRLKDGQTVYTYTPIPSNKWWGDMINIPDIVSIVNNTPGIYKVELTVGGQTMAVDYFFYAVDTQNSSVICDKETYYSFEPMIVHYVIDPYDSSHSYYLVIYDSSGNQIDKVQVYGSSGNATIKAPESGGTYFVVLERDDGVQYAYDTFSVKEEVVFRGYVKDQNGNPLANASVSFNQAGKWYNATTDANGYYEVTGLLANVDVKAKASLSGYESDERTFKVDVAGIHYVNFTLINSSKIKGIYGIVRKEPFGNPVEGAKVTIFNSTWSAETYSNAAGFYNIIPPSFGRYTIRIEKTRFETVEYVVDYNYTYQTILDEKYIPLNSTWNVVVSPSDAPVIDWAYPGYINQYAVNISNTLGDYGTPRYGYIYKNITIQNPKLLKFYVKYWVNTWAPPIGVRVKQNGNVITERYVKGGGTAKSSDWTLEQLNLTNLNNFTVEIFLEDLSTTYAGYDDHGE